MIPMQSVLQDAIAFAYERSFSYRPSLKQNVMASGSMRSSSSGIESMACASDSSDDVDMETDNCSDCSITLQIGRFVVTNYFSKKWRL